MAYDTAQPTHRAQIAEQLDTLTERVEALFKSIEDLQVRLDPVLRPEPPEKNDSETLSPVLVPYAALLRDKNDRLFYAISRIQAIRSLVEL